MENNAFSIFMPRKKNILLEAAWKSLQGIEYLIKLKTKGEGICEVTCSEKIFSRVFPNDLNSPALFWLDAKQYIIYYPKNSTPYSHFMNDKYKFIQILKGSLYDLLSDEILHAGDKIKVDPHVVHSPHTKDKECYIRVKIANCHESWETLGI